MFVFFAPIKWLSNKLYLYLNYSTEMKTFSDNSSDAPFEQRVDARDADRESEVRTEKGTTASVAPAKKESMGQTILNFLGKAVGKFIDVVPRYVSAFAPLLLDFPTTTVLKQPVTIHSGASWAPTRGADNSHILSTDPENKIATDKSLFNCPINIIFLRITFYFRVYSLQDQFLSVQHQAQSFLRSLSIQCTSIQSPRLLSRTLIVPTYLLSQCFSELGEEKYVTEFIL